MLQKIARVWVKGYLDSIARKIFTPKMTIISDLNYKKSKGPEVRWKQSTVCSRFISIIDAKMVVIWFLTHATTKELIKNTFKPNRCSRLCLEEL